jgi:SpoIID/LytB domain protein
MLYRRAVRLFLLAVLVLGAVATPVGAADIQVSGSGWGHGVGLSQYGAKALGSDGATAGQILTRYFPETSIAPVRLTSSGSFLADERALWIGLQQEVESVLFSVGENSSLCFDITGLCFIADPGQLFRFRTDGLGGCVFLNESEHEVTSSVSGSCHASVRPNSLSGTVTLPYKARTYKGGTLRFRAAGTAGKFHVALQLGLEDYMRGLSPVPESWPQESLRAQAVVSRSLAVRTAADAGSESYFDTLRREKCHCHLIDDDSLQVFRGWTGQVGHPNWVEAVEATSQLILTYQSQPALGLYSSSSGGNTESYQDAFGTNEHPYLVSVNDSAAFSSAVANPHRGWTASYDRARLADEFGFSWVADVTVTDRNDSGSARTVEVRGIIGGRPATVIFEASNFQDALSLRSTTFEIVSTQPFLDVSSAHLFVGEIVGLHELGITAGCRPSAYCPDSWVSRGEMAAFISRALGLVLPVSAQSFVDDDTSVFEAEIEAIRAAGITLGCAPERFCPNRPVTRAEMAAFLSRAWALEASAGDDFVDDDGHHLEQEIQALAEAGITLGCGPGSFCPNRPVTRAEMAAFLIRAVDRP